MFLAKHPKLALAVAGIALTCVASCAGGPPTSGLLGDYSGFEKRDDGTLVDQVASASELKRYKRVLLTRSLVYLEPGSTGARISEVDKRTLGRMFDEAIARELDPVFEVVRDPGKRAGDVMTIQAAITDVYPGSPGDGGLDADLGNATVEVEIVDSVSQERLIAAVSRKHAREYSDSKADRMAEAEHAFGEWATALRVWLEEAMQP